MEISDTSNIVRVLFNELQKLGYKPVEITKDKKGNVNPPPPGSFLCLLNSEKNLWVKLSPADIKYSKVTPDKFLILYK